MTRLFAWHSQLRGSIISRGDLSLRISIMSKRNTSDSAHTYAVMMGVAAAITIFLFYTVRMPLIPFDSDDWVLLCKVRNGLPEFGTFNPAKVFAETLPVFCGYAGAYLFRYITGDYLNGIALAGSLVMCLLIGYYIYLIARIVLNTNARNGLGSVCIVIVFFLAHFTALNRQIDEKGIPFLFGSYNFTCYYNYTIPSFLNCCIVMLLMLKGGSFRDFENGRHPQLTVSALALSIYLAIYSNLFSNYTLATYCGACLLFALCDDLKNRRFAMKSFIKGNSIHLFVEILWFASLIFELSGGRADQMQTGLSMSKFIDVLLAYRSMAVHLNRKLLLLLGAPTVLSIAKLLKAKVSSPKQDTVEDRVYSLPTLILFAIFSWAFVSLLTTYIDTRFLVRSEMYVGLAFPLLLISALSLAELFKDHEQLVLVGTFAVFLMTTDAVVLSDKLQPSNTQRMPNMICRKIDDDMINQFLGADAAGQTELMLHVPRYSNSINWPQDESVPGSISYALYRHGMISRPIAAHLYIDDEMTEFYHTL